MKLHSPEFEKNLKRSIKQTVRSDPALRKEARRTKKRSRNRWMSALVRVFFSSVLGIFVWRVLQLTGDVDAALLVINAWLLTISIGIASSLIQLPFQSPRLAALRLLPVAEPVIFRWEFDRFLRGSLYCLIDSMVGFGVLGWIIHLSPLQWSASLILACLTWAFSVSLAMLGAARAPQLPYGIVWVNLYLVWFAVLMSAKINDSLLLTFLKNTGPAFNLLVPTGWPLCLFHLLLADGRWLLGLFLFPILVIIYTFKSSRKIIQDRFIYNEPMQAEAADLMPDESPTKTAIEGGEKLGRRSIGVTAIEEGIVSGQFLARYEWSKEWMASILWQYFTDREKTLAEFCFPVGLSFLKPWRTVARNLFISLVLGFGAAYANLTLSNWILGLGFFIVFAHAMGLTLRTGSAFRTLPNGGVHIPVYAAYPISYRELSRMLMKCTLIQLPFFTLVITITAASLIHFFEESVVEGVVMGVKASVLFIGARFLIMVFAFSSCTGDTSRLRFRSFGILILFLIFGGLFLVLGSVGIFLPYKLVSWLCCAAAVLLTYLFFRLYGWFYNSNRFDLMREPSR